MERVCVLSMEEAANRIRSTDPSRLVFWVGAGVDAKKPSLLPLGDNLRYELLQTAVGEFATKIDDEWERTRETLLPVLADRLVLPQYQRLETIIECIRYFESNLKHDEGSLLGGFSSFQNVPPNDNHFVLASFLERGANIVTTNYEDCIARALKTVSGGRDLLTVTYADPGSSLHILSCPNPRTGKVYYLHGVASDPTNIGISLSSIKDGLGAVFIRQLEDWIHRDSLFIYLGYSGLDSLDVNPILQSLPAGKASAGLYIRYFRSEEPVAHVAEQTENESALLRPFRERYLCQCNTDNLFLALDDAREGGAPDFDWKREFAALTRPYPKKLHSTLALGIVHTLHLNPNRIVSGSCYRDAENYDSVKGGYINYFCFRLAQQQRKLPLMYRYAEQSDQEASGTDEKRKRSIPIICLRRSKLREISAKDDLACEYYVSLVAGLRAIQYLYPKPSELTGSLNRILDGRGTLVWTYFTSYTRFMDGIMIRFSIWPFCFRRLEQKNRKDIDFLISDFQRIVRVGYSCTIEANQINTTLRTLGIALTLFRNEYCSGRELIEQSLKNYASTTYIQGISGTLIYSAFAYCIQFIRTRNREYRKLAFRELRLSRTITTMENDRTFPRKLLLAYAFVVISPLLHRLF
ncbi:MAG: SIR2 family protein [Eubacteriales bacterium]|nr:SIR2 family protein [Eubacteriales bacterium]